MPRSLFAALVALCLSAPAALLEPDTVTAATPTVQVAMPAAATPGRPLAITITLPGNVAAVDGRLLMRKGVAELIGVAPEGRGTGLRPVEVQGGAAFGAYGLQKVDGRRTIRLVLLPEVAGKLQIRVVIDSAASKAGKRVLLQGTDRLANVSVGSGKGILSAPLAPGGFAPTRAARRATEVVMDGTIDVRDLDVVRAGWEESRQTDAACGGSHEADINDDGCTDIVDLQATLAAEDTVTDTPPPTGIGGRTLVVDSSADTADVDPGDGVCADSQDRCTLRAAMAEADYLQGEDRIEFDLPGTAPVRIQLDSRLPVINSRSGGVIIDGYSQPGSSVNTATVGSNAVPGVEIRGNGNGDREVAFRITSPGNVIRGLLINNVYRPIFIDGDDAHGNYVVGNLLGFTAAGNNHSSGNFGVILNTGSHDNHVGTPDLADRNVIGNYSHAVDNYGPGTDGNTIQNNVLCIGPSGLTTASCSVGIDHNFGPKANLIGGTGPNERNYIGRTTLQCIEFSHGWDPAVPWGDDTATTYQINDHRVIGNWLGFRADGSYDSAFRCGQNSSSGDNANGVNIYDGTYDNLVEGNHIGSVYDGVHVMAPNSQRNIVRGNTIGESPLGERAPMNWWGVRMRWGTKHNVVEDNIIRNAARGGVGLTQHTVYNVRISRNLVFGTSGPGIHLQPHPNDPDTGANVLLDPPVITSANTNAVSGTGIAGATVEVFRASRPAGESGLPDEYLGSATVSGSGAWTVPVSAELDSRVTALQIRPDQNTSTLATNVAVVDGGDPTDPPPAGVLAEDDFERNLADGWGEADFGGSWTLGGNASDFSVSDGAGWITADARQHRQARLAVDAADISVTGRFSVDRLPDVGNVFGYIDTRANGNTSYRGTIRVNPSGAVFAQLRKSVANTESAVMPEAAVPGLSAAGGAWLAFRFEVAGETLALKVWAAGDPEPAGWNTITTDSTAGLTGAGSAGVRAYTGGPVPNGPVSFGWDDLEFSEAEPVEPPPDPEPGDVVAADDFDRDVSGGWGAATLGGTWSQNGGAADFSVSDGQGHVSTEARQARQSRLPISHQDVSVSGQVTFDRVPGAGNTFAYIDTRVDGNNAFRGTLRVNSNGAVFAQLQKLVGGTESAVADGVATGLSAAGEAPLAFRFEVVGSTLSLRVWAAGDPEPSTWNTTATDSTAALQGAGRVGIRAYTGGPVPNGPVTTSWDDLEVRLP